MFGREKKKKDEKKVPPAVSETPMVAYVERTVPVTWRGIKVNGNLPEGPFRNILSIVELEERVAAVAGGHDFIVKFHEQGNTAEYLGSHQFSVADDPMRNGEPIGKQEIARGGKKGETNIQAEIENTKNQIELDIIQAKRRKKQEELEHDNEEEPMDIDIDSVREEFTDQIGQAINGLKEVMLQKNEQDQQKQQHRELLEAIKTQSPSQGPMDAIKEIITAGAESNRAILSAMDSNRKEANTAIAGVLATMQSKSDSLIQMFLTQMNQHVQTQMTTFQQLNEVRGDSAQKSIDLMKETLSMGVALGMGRDVDGQPKTITDVLAGFSDKVADIAGELLKQRGGEKLTKEGLKDIMGRVAKKAVARTKSEMSKQITGPQASGIPGAQPAERPTAEAGPTAVVEPVVSGFEPNDLQRSAMNSAIREWIKDMEERSDVDSAAWIQIGNRTLPMDMLQEFMAAQGNPEQWRGILQKYGDPSLVNELVTKIQSIVARDDADLEADVESAVDDQVADQVANQTGQSSSLEEHVEAEIGAGMEASVAEPEKESPAKVEPSEKPSEKAAPSPNRPSVKKPVAKRAKKKAGKAGKAGS